MLPEELEQAGCFLPGTADEGWSSINLPTGYGVVEVVLNKMGVDGLAIPEHLITVAVEGGDAGDLILPVLINITDGEVADRAGEDLMDFPRLPPFIRRKNGKGSLSAA